MDNISVIIRAKNEERWIGHTIQSVLDLIKNPQIIVIDNNSTDKTLHIVKSFMHDPDLNNGKNRRYTEIIIKNINDYSPGKALNLGVNYCKFEYILVISSHCVLKNFNITKIKKELQKHACVFGNQTPLWEGKKITKRYLWSHFGEKEVQNMYSEMENRHFLHNALAVYKKQTLIDHPFDENLIGKEDRYWANHIIDNGLTTLYDPQMVVDHHYTENGNTWKGIG